MKVLPAEAGRTIIPKGESGVFWNGRKKGALGGISTEQLIVNGEGRRQRASEGLYGVAIFQRL